MNNLDGTDALVGTQSVECFEVDGCSGVFTWVTSSWSDCHSSLSSSDLGDLCQSALKRYLDGESQNIPNDAIISGYQTRTARCVIHSASSEDIQREAPEQYCEKANVPKPIEQQTCNAAFSCYRWSTVQFSSVSMT